MRAVFGGGGDGGRSGTWERGSGGEEKKEGDISGEALDDIHLPYGGGESGEMGRRALPAEKLNGIGIDLVFDSRWGWFYNAPSAPFRNSKTSAVAMWFYYVAMRGR